jgi:hypothetical protein
VPVPPDLAAVILCSNPKQARFRSGVKQYRWEAGERVYTLIENPLAWGGNLIDNGQLAQERSGVFAGAWSAVATSRPEWPACRDLLKAQAVARGDWHFVTAIMLKGPGKANPRLSLNLGSDRPYDLHRDPPGKQPQIVPVAQGDSLVLAWQSWGARAPTGRISVVRVPTQDLASGKLLSVREVASLGALVGFTINQSGTDYVLSARAEDFPIQAPGDFAERIHKQWQPDALRLYRDGQAKDLNSSTYAEWPFYGVTNAGTGRLAAGGGKLAAVFARRQLGGGLIHQLASDLLMNDDLGSVTLRAGIGVSHSFDQRVIFDGGDFVSLHQGDTYPCAGLIIEKLRSTGGRRSAGYAAYSCPTFQNDVYFELGGLAAEADGYPVLFTSTRNTQAVTPANRDALARQAWDVGLVYVRRDFDKQPPPTNRYDIVGSGILASGFAPDEEIKVANFAWNPESGRFDKPEPRVIRRRVFWLTKNPGDVKATRAKFVTLREGHYVAVWEEHRLEGEFWNYQTARAQLLMSSNKDGTLSFQPGRRVELPGLRLPEGDDAVSVSIKGTAHAAWVTAASNRQLTLETLDENLTHRSFALRLP